MKRNTTPEIERNQQPADPSESPSAVQAARAEWSAPTYKEIDCASTWFGGAGPADGGRGT
jgi:hypothetical protein